MRPSRALPWLLGSIIALGPTFVGCGGEEKNQMVVPEKSDVESSKASIEYTKKRLAEEAAKRK
jgi:hypothetical protein